MTSFKVQKVLSESLSHPTELGHTLIFNTSCILFDNYVKCLITYHLLSTEIIFLEKFEAEVLFITKYNLENKPKKKRSKRLE